MFPKSWRHGSAGHMHPATQALVVDLSFIGGSFRWLAPGTLGTYVGIKLWKAFTPG